MWIDLARLAVLPYLLSAAVDDRRTRLVHSRVWRIPLAVAVACLLADAWTGRGTAALALASAAGLGGLAYIWWLVGGLGMADVKAIVVMSLAFPVQPDVHPALPVLAPVEGAFPVVALLYCVLVSMAWPIATAVRNALNGRWSLDMPFVEHVGADDLPGTHGWLRGDQTLLSEADPASLPSEGVHEVDPAMPFLVPLLIGLVIAIIVGAP